MGPLFDFCPSVICQKFNSKVWSKMWHFLSSNGCTVALCWSLCNFRLFFSPHCKPEEMSRLVPHKNRIGIFNTKENFLFLMFSRSHLQKTVESYYVKGLVPVRDRKSKWLWLKWPWKSKFSWGLRVDAELIIFLGLLNDLAKPSE